MGDVLDVAVIVRDIGRASVRLTVHAFKDGTECVRATFVTVTTSLVDHKTIALPDSSPRVERLQGSLRRFGHPGLNKHEIRTEQPADVRSQACPRGKLPGAQIAA